jgi:hypothetical protein
MLSYSMQQTGALMILIINPSLKRLLTYSTAYSVLRDFSLVAITACGVYTDLANTHGFLEDIISNLAKGNPSRVIKDLQGFIFQLLVKAAAEVILVPIRQDLLSAESFSLQGLYQDILGLRL